MHFDDPIAWLLLLPLIVIFLISVPIKHTFRPSWTRTIDADIDTVWKVAMAPALFNPTEAELQRARKMRPELVSSKCLSQDPLRAQMVYEIGGRRVNQIVRIDASEPPRRLRLHYEMVDGHRAPHGADSYFQFDLKPAGEKTDVRTTGQFRSKTLFHSLQYFRLVQRNLAPIQAYFAGKRISSDHVGGLRSMLWSIGISIAAVGSFMVLFGWQMGLIIAAVVLFHEFGHWLAMRMTGQPTSRFMLVPFFGGLAVAKFPHRTQFHDAFCSLMGPGLSAVLCAVLIAGYFITGAPVLGDAGLQGLQSTPIFSTIGIMLAAAMLVIAILNVIQLLPFYPLDGGQILRSIVESYKPGWTNHVLTLSSATAVGLALMLGSWFLTAIAAWFTLQSVIHPRPMSKSRPMSLAELSAICIGTALTIAIYALSIYIPMRLAFQDVWALF